MNRKSVFKWCGEFKDCRTSVHDDQRSGKPWIDWQNCWKNRKEDSRLTVDVLSAMFPQISRSLQLETIIEILEYRNLSARWVPKQLTDQHKLNQVEAGQAFLRRYKLYGNEFLQITSLPPWSCTRVEDFQPTRIWRGKVDEGFGGILLRGRHQNINTPDHHLHWEKWWVCRKIA